MSTFEVVHGAEGDCLLLDDTRISGPKPWGGGTVTKTFHTDGAYAVVPKDELDRLKAENEKLQDENEMMRNRVAGKYRAMLNSPNPVLRLMAEDELRELGIEVKQ